MIPIKLAPRGWAAFAARSCRNTAAMDMPLPPAAAAAAAPAGVLGEGGTAAEGASPDAATARAAVGDATIAEADVAPVAGTPPDAAVATAGAGEAAGPGVPGSATVPAMGDGGTTVTTDRGPAPVGDRS